MSADAPEFQMTAALNRKESNKNHHQRFYAVVKEDGMPSKGKKYKTRHSNNPPVEHHVGWIMDIREHRPRTASVRFVNNLTLSSILESSDLCKHFIIIVCWVYFTTVAALVRAQVKDIYLAVWAVFLHLCHHSNILLMLCLRKIILHNKHITNTTAAALKVTRI